MATGVKLVNDDTATTGSFSKLIITGQNSLAKGARFKDIQWGYGNDGTGNQTVTGLIADFIITGSNSGSGGFEIPGPIIGFKLENDSLDNGEVLAIYK
tara:strand:+ start:36 stop:329 length:294 start_codon:yes stop_codon:yes gene_type:complete